MTQEERDKLVAEIRASGVGTKVSPEMLTMFPVKKMEEQNIPTRCGTTHCYVYWPETAQEGPLPLFINIHGGGFVKGHREQDVVFATNICRNAECVVVDIDYVTAPEQKYPYALHQCYDVVKYCYENPEVLGIDKERIVVGGHSAGGNLTAALSLLNVQEPAFQIKLAFLDYAPTDMNTPPELKRNAYSIPRLQPDRCRFYNELYVDNDRRYEPTASPLYAPQEMLEKMPPVLAFTCGKDPLCDEGEAFVEKLIHAGIEVHAKRFVNSSHGFLVRRKEEYAEGEKILFAALKTAFAK